MGILVQPKIIFIVDAVHLPSSSSSPSSVCRRHLSMATRRFSRCPIEKPSADASLMPSLIDYPQVESCHLSFRLSRATRMEHFSTDRRLGIIARRVPFDLFECASPARVNRRARYQSYLSLNKTHDGALNRGRVARRENNLSYIRSSLI